MKFQYVTNQATRIIIKAAGELSLASPAALEEQGLDVDFEFEGVGAEEDMNEKLALPTPADRLEDPIDIETYRPHIRSDRSWCLSELDLGM